MFSQLRQSNQVFILHKTSTPYVEVGNVESISNLPIMGYYPNLPTMPVDIVVRIGDKSTPYKQLPANSEVASVISQTTGEEIIIACSKDAINSEVQQMKQKSIETINSIEYHKQRITMCDQLLNQLNPEIAEKAQQAQEINELKGEIASLRDLISSLKASSSKTEDYGSNSKNSTSKGG